MIDGVEKLVAEITSDDAERRTAAWLNAYTLGPAAIKPLVKLSAHDDIMVRHASAQALRRMARLAGRPGSDGHRMAVEREMTGLLTAGLPAAASREILWILSEIGGDACVDAIAKTLSDPQVREDAKMALERIPGEASLAALKAAVRTVPKDFRASVRHSLQKHRVQKIS